MIQPGCFLDTGPLVALFQEEDDNHDRAKSLFSALQPPFLTCEAVLVEACFLLGKYHRHAPPNLMRLGHEGFYQTPLHLDEHWNAVRNLLNKYQDQPISLADACLIRLAEIHQEPRILTFDSDFEFYRWGKNKKFEIICD